MRELLIQNENMKNALKLINEFNQIIDDIEARCMAIDGPVTPTLQEAKEEELSRLWEILNAVKTEFFEPIEEAEDVSSTVEKAAEYLLSQGIDPKECAEQGVMFVKATVENIKIKESLRCFTPDVFPKRTDDAPEYSVTVGIIDEHGLDGLGWYDYEDKQWRFHTDTLVDYNEPGAPSEWMWYYIPITWEKAKTEYSHLNV